jgi:hypothetical protein
VLGGMGVARYGGPINNGTWGILARGHRLSPKIVKQL